MNPDLLILGAGIAGLRAADLLSESGLRVTLLEARDRIGGRIHTLSPTSHPSNPSHPSHPLDLGAEFIHGRPPQTWHLFKQAGLTAYDVPDNHYFRRGDRLVQNNQFWPQIQDVMSRLSEARPSDLSFDDFLSSQRKLSSRARRSARDFVRGFDAADTAKIGVAGLVAAEKKSEKIDGDLLFRPLGGYHLLTNHLAEKFHQRGGKVHLNTIVRRIEWSPQGCRVIAEVNRKLKIFTAKKILVTLPVGVLKSGDITFSPAVPQFAESLAGLEMGPVIKIIFRFRSPFWEERGYKDLSFFHTPADPFPTWWTQLPLRLPLLTAWSAGARASEIAGQTKAQLLNTALTTLARCFGTSQKWLIRQLEEHHLANWPADPFARGAYSYITTDGLPAVKNFQNLGQNILFFAGEHTDAELIGTVAAALASAERITPRILSTI